MGAHQKKARSELFRTQKKARARGAGPGIFWHVILALEWRTHFTVFFLSTSARSVACCSSDCGLRGGCARAGRLPEASTRRSCGTTCSRSCSPAPTWANRPAASRSSTTSSLRATSDLLARPPPSLPPPLQPARARCRESMKEPRDARPPRRLSCGRRGLPRRACRAPRQIHRGSSGQRSDLARSSSHAGGWPQFAM